ncbi:MAG TPA: SDR family oxidoreductase [Terriglobales bacterium]|nr:SDR family oxidoreductase [Terriglobales bacterium]
MILVTGAGGTVGSEVVKQLKAAGAQFRVGFHSPAKAEKAKAEGLAPVLFDFADRASVAAALQGADKLFLLSGNMPNQVEAETAAVEEAKKAGVKHIVKLSVLQADKERYSFARWHRAVEKAIEKSGVAYTFLRPTGFMQNFVTYQSGSIRGQGALYEPMDAKVSHVDVRDVAAVAVKALLSPGHEGKAYELTGPEALSYGQVADKISRATGREVRAVFTGPEAARQSMLGMGMPPFMVDAVLDLQEVYATGASEKVYPDIEQVTGRRARSFDDFLRDHLKAFQP